MASDSEDEMPMSNDDFMEITGYVEDIFIGEEYQTLHKTHCDQSWELFTECGNPEEEENSSELEKKALEKFQVFKAYSVKIAQYLENTLKQSLGDEFEIQRYLMEVESRIKKVEAIAARENASESDTSVTNSPRCAAGGGEAAAAAPAKCEQPFIPSHELSAELIGMDGEIFDMLLTLRDYARFQEFMTDYAKMMKGQTPNLGELVSLRALRLSDEDDDDKA